MLKQSPSQDISFADAFAELESLVREFEQNDTDIEKSIPRFKRGLELAALLKKRLQLIENEIEEIKTQFQDTSS